MFVRRYIQKARYGAYFSCTCVLLIVFLNDITAISLDRLPINYNHIQEIDKQQKQQVQDKNNNDFNKNSLLSSKSVVIDNAQYLPIDLYDQNHLTVVSVNQYDEDNEDELTIDNNFLSDKERLNVDANRQNDMVMLESQNQPVIVEMLQLPDGLKETLVNNMKNKDAVITTDKKQPITYNNEQSMDRGEEIEYELHQINKSPPNDFSQQDMMLQNPMQEKKDNDNRKPEEFFENESIGIPMIGVAQEEQSPHLDNEMNFKGDTPYKKSEIPIENNGGSSFNVLQNQLQENSERSEISKGEDYISNEEDDMPEECGDEYYMNPNQGILEHTSEFASNSKETTKPFDMELEVIPSEEGLEEVERGHELKKVINAVSNIEKEWKVPSALVSLTHINQMEPITTKNPLTLSPETDSKKLIDETTKPSLNEQVDVYDNVDNSEVKSELMEETNAMGNHTLLNRYVEIPPKVKDEYLNVVKSSEGNLNHESVTDTLISTTKSVNLYGNDNMNNLYSIPSQQQQQNLTEMEEKNMEPTEIGFNSKLRRYDGAQVWRIVVQNDKERMLADELNIKFGGQLWKEVKQEIDYLLKPQVLTQAEEYVRAANLSRIVLIDNLQEVIEIENPPAEEIAQLQNRKGHRLTWQAYHRLEDIHGFFDYLAKTYTDICSVEIIGYSIQKRPLKILKISSGQANNTGIWIDGGIHAREWISPAVVTYVANHLVEGWDDLPAYMRKINWYIHAVVNPDGYEYSHTTDRLWRKNMRSHGRLCPGVDLNRNFGYMWGGRGTSANPCSQIYRGTKAFSEPEAFYISKFLSGFPKGMFKGYLSFHSYGQYILYPWGYDYLETNDTMDLDLLARQAGTSVAKSTGVKYTVGAAANTLYAAAGGSDDWAKGIAEIKYTYTIEMGDTGRYGFVLPASEIECNGKNAYTVVKTIARGIMMGKNGRRRKLQLRHN